MKQVQHLLHLALGDSAAGCLRAACRTHGMPGSVVGIPDDLSHGPLDDGRARLAYMRACFRGYDDWPFDITDAFAPWQGMIERLNAEQTEAVLVWSGDNVSEGSFIAMACWWLRARPERILRVTMADAAGRCHVATHAPAELADRFSARRLLTDTERATLAQDFTRIRDQTGLLRCWEDGRLIGVPIDCYDQVLLDACAPTWTPAPRVVGTAMSRCGQRNAMSDLFFASRLQVLIDAGSLQADGPRRRLRDYAVRLAPVCPGNGTRATPR